MTTQPHLELRPFVESDDASVIALWTTAFGYSAPHNRPRNLIDQKLAFQRELFFVALLDGQLVGTVMGGYDGHRGWIYSLAVRGSSRRQGIGTVMVRHIERALESRGCLKINLQVLESNATTVDFYKKLGYQVEPRVSMGKILNRS